MDWLADGLPTGYRLMAAQATDGKTKILKMYIKIIKILFHYYTTTRKTFPLCNTKPNSLERVLRQMPLKQYNAIFIRKRFIFSLESKSNICDRHSKIYLRYGKNAES